MGVLLAVTAGPNNVVSDRYCLNVMENGQEELSMYGDGLTSHTVTQRRVCGAIYLVFSVLEAIVRAMEAALRVKKIWKQSRKPFLMPRDDVRSKEILLLYY